MVEWRYAPGAESLSEEHQADSGLSRQVAVVADHSVLRYLPLFAYSLILFDLFLHPEGERSKHLSGPSRRSHCESESFMLIFTNVKPTSRFWIAF